MKSPSKKHSIVNFTYPHVITIIVHGFWSSFGSFGEWSNCSESCGGGIKNRKRFRTCTDPPPSDKGNPCVGKATDSEELNCNTEDCFRKCFFFILCKLFYKLSLAQESHFDFLKKLYFCAKRIHALNFLAYLLIFFQYL